MSLICLWVTPARSASKLKPITTSKKFVQGFFLSFKVSSSFTLISSIYIHFFPIYYNFLEFRITPRFVSVLFFFFCTSQGSSWRRTNDWEIWPPCCDRAWKQDNLSWFLFPSVTRIGGSWTASELSYPCFRAASTAFRRYSSSRPASCCLESLWSSSQSR